MVMMGCPSFVDATPQRYQVSRDLSGGARKRNRQGKEMIVFENVTKIYDQNVPGMHNQTLHG
jgi:hypothetical protein